MQVLYESGERVTLIATKYEIDAETVRRRLRKRGVHKRLTAHTADLTGRLFGRLTVQGRAVSPGRKTTHRHWRCRCSCGAIVVTCTAHLVSGHSTSCGCARTDRITGFTLRHGLSGTSEYQTWINMKQRCLNPKASSFRHYGGRGITICDNWRDNFAAFFADIGPRPSAKHSIERLDNNGQYSPENCRWVLQIEQMNNNRRSRRIEYRGERRTLTQWLRVTGLPKHGFLMRVLVARDAEIADLRQHL